jgi:hypothetical protein
MFARCFDTFRNPHIISKLFFFVLVGKLASDIGKKIFRNVLNFGSVSWLFNTESQLSLFISVMNSLIVSYL